MFAYQLLNKQFAPELALPSLFVCVWTQTILPVSSSHCPASTWSPRWYRWIRPSASHFPSFSVSIIWWCSSSFRVGWVLEALSCYGIFVRHLNRAAHSWWWHASLAMFRSAPYKHGHLHATVPSSTSIGPCLFVSSSNRLKSAFDLSFTCCSQPHPGWWCIQITYFLALLDLVRHIQHETCSFLVSFQSSWYWSLKRENSDHSSLRPIQRIFVFARIRIVENGIAVGNVHGPEHSAFSRRSIQHPTAW